MCDTVTGKMYNIQLSQSIITKPLCVCVCVCVCVFDREIERLVPDKT